MKHPYGAKQTSTTIEVNTIVLPSLLWEEVTESIPKPWARDIITRDLDYLGGVSCRVAATRWGVSPSKANKIINEWKSQLVSK